MKGFLFGVLLCSLALNWLQYDGQAVISRGGVQYASAPEKGYSQQDIDFLSEIAAREGK